MAQLRHFGRSHAPLDVRIDRGKLEITIGVETLRHAIQLAPELGEFDDHGWWHGPKITDAALFAKELARELNAEAEDGTTLVHIALDAAATKAIENGAEGVEMPEDQR